MSTRIIALFNLRDGVSRADYEKWARDVDLPTVSNLSSIDGFEIFRTAGCLGSDKPAPYQYIEIIDVNDMGQFGADVSTEKMQAIATEFQKIADVTFILTEKL